MDVSAPLMVMQPMVAHLPVIRPLLQLMVASSGFMEFVLLLMVVP